jgi:hypothetical protein
MNTCSSQSFKIVILLLYHCKIVFIDLQTILLRYWISSNTSIALNERLLVIYVVSIYIKLGISMYFPSKQ